MLGVMLLIALYVYLGYDTHQNSFFPHSLYCSLKLECEKLATEKTEIQRHYVMVRHTLHATTKILLYTEKNNSSITLTQCL